MKLTKLRQTASFLTVAGSVLDKLNIEVDESRIFPQIGRNHSAILQLGNDESVFLKIITGLDSTERFNRLISFENASQYSSPILSPKLIDFDSNGLAVFYHVVDDATKVSDLLTSNLIAMDVWHSIGAEIGKLHSWRPVNSHAIKADIPSLPPKEDAVFELEFYESASAGQLDLFHILQADQSLGKAVNQLLQMNYVPVPTHGDLRTDQLLLAKDELWFIDWEDFRMSDPARDLGSLMGEIFFHSMKPLFKKTADRGAITNEAICLVGSELVDDVRPIISAIWKGYCSQTHYSSCETEELVDRTIGFLGWQMFDRVLSIGGITGRISNFEKSIIGIGRQMIMYRSGYSEVLGF